MGAQFNFQVSNGTSVEVKTMNEALLKDERVIKQIIKNSNRYQTKDFGIKVCENSSLQDVKDSCITNRRIQRTNVGIYPIRYNGEKYIMSVCDNPNITNSSLLANILNFDKI